MLDQQQKSQNTFKNPLKTRLPGGVPASTGALMMQGSAVVPDVVEAQEAARREINV